MGLFDTVKDKLFCPFCGKQQDSEDFQSKDLGDHLESWTIEDIKRFFPKSPNEHIQIGTYCKYCKEWISINLDLWRMKKPEDNRFKKEVTNNEN